MTQYSWRNWCDHAAWIWNARDEFSASLCFGWPLPLYNYTVFNRKGASHFGSTQISYYCIYYLLNWIKANTNEFNEFDTIYSIQQYHIIDLKFRFWELRFFFKLTLIIYFIALMKNRFLRVCHFFEFFVKLIIIAIYFCIALFWIFSTE